MTGRSRKKAQRLGDGGRTVGMDHRFAFSQPACVTTNDPNPSQEAIFKRMVSRPVAAGLTAS